MATTTTNYGLKKPDYNDNADIGVINDNMDTIDTELKNISETSTSDISRLKGYPYLQNTTISDYLDNNFSQNNTESYNIRFLAVSSDNVGDLPTSSAYHISATRNHGGTPWCLEATEVVANGFKKFIGYKGTGNNIVWQEVARKSDIYQYIIPVKFDANSLEVGLNYRNLNMEVPDGYKVISTVVDYSSWNDALFGTCSTDGAFVTYAKNSPSIDIYGNIKVTVARI